MIIARVWGPEDIFLYWPAQLNAILRANRASYLVRSEYVASSSSSHMAKFGGDVFDDASDVKNARDVAYVNTLKGIGEVPFANVM